MGLDLQKDLSQQITEAVGLLTLSISKLETAQNEAERLQNDINRLIEEKKPFDSNKAKADTAKLKAETAVKTNADEIIRMEKEHGELTQECESIKADINTILADYCNDWLSDTETLRKQLKDDAKTYADQRKRLTDSQAEQEKANTLTATLSQYSQDILRACPDWKANRVD